jgi:putative endonuclease
MDKGAIGKRGEDLAVRFLKRRGFEVLDRNYWKKWGEIDIVARKSNSIHFVEVKTVTRDRIPTSGADSYEPEDNLHPWKRRRLARVIETYLLDKQVGEEIDWQVDALAVYLDPAGNELKCDFLEDISL